MQAFVELIKFALRPTSLDFLIILLVIGVIVSFARRTQRLGRWYFAAVLAFYWIASAPVFVETLMRWQQTGQQHLTSAAEARGARVVVVLGAGSATIQANGQSLNVVTWTAALRLLEAARLYRLLDRPTIIVSGGVTQRVEGARSEGDAMRSAILELGVPSDHIVVEGESMTTRDEALVIARMLANQPRLPIVLVTSPTHMARAVAVFRAAGLDPVPSVAPYKSDHSLDRLRWLPSDDGLLMFDTFVYDIAATWYYWLRGWIPR